ncbi:MAG: diacylglycerol kinase family protein [Candidatus Neomarinimicrobiota bacterium]
MTNKRFILAVNPFGGKKKALEVLKRVTPVFESSGAKLEIRETEYAGHAGDMINQIDFSDWDGFCLVGGDGTLHEVLNGLLTRTDAAQIPIGCIPAGTGNSFMHDLNCLDPVEAARKILQGKTRPIDVAEIRMGSDTVYAFNVVGWGMATDINVTAEKVRWLGESRYTLVTLLHLLKLVRRPARLIIDGGEDEDEFIFAMGCNTQHTGKGMRLAPYAKLDDGLIDLVIVRNGSRWKLLKLFLKVFDGSHVSDPLVEYHQVKKYSIISRENDILNVDGELKGNTPFEVSVVPGAFHVFM